MRDIAPGDDLRVTGEGLTCEAVEGRARQLADDVAVVSAVEVQEVLWAVGQESRR